MSQMLRAHLALLFVNLIYGVNYLVAKGVMPDLIEPSGFILLRVHGATVLFWIAQAMYKRQRIAREDLGRFALCGLFGVAANQLFFFNGLNLTSPVNASIIMTANPILVLVMAGILIGERVSLVRLIGVVLGAIGAVWLIYSSAGGSDVLGDWKGDVMILINAISYALYLVLVKPLMKKYSPITVISWVFLMGSVFVLPFGWSQFQAVEWTSFTLSDTLSVIFVVVATTFLAYLLNIYAIKLHSPSVVSSYIYLQPITVILFAALFAWWGWSEIDYTGGITVSKVLSALMIFAGVYLVSKPGIDKARKDRMSKDAQ